jgi:hypothetical protein
MFANGKGDNQKGPFSITDDETVANQARLEYYVNNDRRTKMAADDNYYVSLPYWEASPSSKDGNITSFPLPFLPTVCVVVLGETDYMVPSVLGAGVPAGVAPAFCVK